MKNRIEAQLRFNDIDILGHLNNTVYFSLYDLGKAKYMEEVGLREPGPVAPTSVIADVHCSYFKPVHYGDEIYIETSCSEVGNKHFILDQEMIDSNGDIRSRCRTVMVYIDPSTQKAGPVPQHYRDKIAHFESL